MKKRVLSIFVFLCIIITILPVNITTSSAYYDENGNYLYYEINSYNDITITGCDDSATNIIIPQMIDNHWVTTIGDYAFSKCNNLKSAELPSTLFSIGMFAFEMTGLTEVYIPGNVSSIGYGAFRKCYNLKKVNIPYSVRSVDDWIFELCYNLNKVYIDYGLPEISYNMFYGCSSLSNIEIPDSVTTIDIEAFRNCTALTSIVIPKSVAAIRSGAFYNCSSLSDIIVDENNLNYCSIDGVLFDKEKTKLIKYGEGKTDTEYEIPNTVKSIENDAFSGCNKIATIYYNGTAEEWNGISNNTCLSEAKRVFFAYINISDKDGNNAVSTTQNMGEYVDTSSITVPDGYKVILFKDKEMTIPYSLDTPISENLNLYYDIIEINKLKITGTESADIGQKGITESVTFATDKTAKYFVATLKYSGNLNFVEAKSEIFNIETDPYTDDGQKYLSLTCTYKNDGNMPKNTTLNAFDLVFDVSESATANEKLTIEFVNDGTLLSDDSGNNEYFDGLETAEIKVNPILVSNITINGADEIDKATQYTAVISPEKVTNKEVEWSVDNSEIATISADGILTPVKAGTVKITATAKGGNGISSEKSVKVKVYATITSLTANVGVWNKAFIPTEKEYTIYVPKNTSTIRLTAKHSGTLSGSDKTFISNVAKPISLSADEIVLTLTYSQTGYTDSEYKIKIVKFEGTKTTVSEDGKTFTIKPINIASGNTVILALYNGDTFVEMQSKTYSGENIPFITDKAYTTAKIMVWNNLDDIMPICEAEIVNTESNL